MLNNKRKCVIHEIKTDINLNGKNILNFQKTFYIYLYSQYSSFKDSYNSFGQGEAKFFSKFEYFPMIRGSIYNPLPTNCKLKKLTYEIDNWSNIINLNTYLNFTLTHQRGINRDKQVEKIYTINIPRNRKRYFGQFDVMGFSF